MVGQWTMTKPSRSDEVLDANQQLQITNQIRAQFDSMVPKRPSKPSRSESDTTTTPTSSLSEIEQDNIPELDKLRSLQSQSPVCYLHSTFTFFLDMLVSLTVTGERYIYRTCSAPPRFYFQLREPIWCKMSLWRLNTTQSWILLTSNTTLYRSIFECI